MTETLDTSKLNLDALLKNIISNPAAALEQGDKMLQGLSPEECDKLQSEAKKIASGPLGADLRKKLLQQGINQRKMKQMMRTNKTMVKGKRGEDPEKGVIVTEARRLKYFDIYRSQESQCINNAVGGLGVSIPLTQRLQNSEYKDKGIKFAYNPRSPRKENRRSKKFIHTKFPIRGDIAIYRDIGSISMRDIETIESILTESSVDGQREMQVRKAQTAAKEAGLDAGLLKDENCVFGKKEEEKNYGNHEDYLLDVESDEETEVQIEDDNETDSDDEEIEKMLAL